MIVPGLNYSWKRCGARFYAILLLFFDLAAGRMPALLDHIHDEKLIANLHEKIFLRKYSVGAERAGII